MAKLHEVLAVETSLSESANRVLKGTTKTLDTKRDIFSGLTKAHAIFAEEDQHLVQATEIKEVESTVDEQIDYACVELARYWDVTLQKEEANQRAKANIFVDGKTLAENVPVIVLLSMEKKLESLLAMYNAIPTLDATTAWEEDKTYAKPGVWRMKHPVERQQSVEIKDWVEVSPATVQHKAQIEESRKTVVIGKFTVTGYSGAVTSLDKAQRIQRLTSLIRGVKTARQRANNEVVKDELTFGKKLLDFVNGK